MSWREMSSSMAPTSSSMVSSLSALRRHTPARHAPAALTYSYRAAPDCDEVYPGLFIGDAVAAKDKAYLQRMGITHVLNTAEGRRYTQVDTGHLYYRDCPRLRYRGFPLMDTPAEDISKYFYSSAHFIEEAISGGGRVLVHCLMGVSRSATCAIAWLMLRRNMSLAEALSTVRARRDVHPNEGFIAQLQRLDRELRSHRVR